MSHHWLILGKILLKWKIVFATFNIQLFFWVWAFMLRPADEIITKNIQASSGGVDKLKSIQSVVMEGKINAQGMENPYQHVNGQKTRQCVRFQCHGHECLDDHAKDSGWTFMPFRVKQTQKPFPAICLKRLRTSWIFEGELVDYKEKVPLNNISDGWRGRTGLPLKLITKAGNVHYYLIDPKTFYTVRRIAKQNAGGKEVEVQVDMGNYKK